MSEYEELQAMLVSALDSMSLYAGSVSRYAQEADKEIARLWKDNAALRDDLHALANRVETLTRARLTEPAEVAAKIVNAANRSTLRQVRDDA